jgi:hypothetical protein
MVRYHSCGCPIWVSRKWKGRQYYSLYADAGPEAGGVDVGHCPRCGELLSSEVLYSEPCWPTAALPKPDHHEE